MLAVIIKKHEYVHVKNVIMIVLELIKYLTRIKSHSHKLLVGFKSIKSNTNKFTGNNDISDLSLMPNDHSPY